jgi:pectate lyase
MKTKLFTLLTALVLASSQIFSQDLCTPVGWATQNGGTTGGGNATPTVVTTYAALKTALTSATVKVVHIQGTITFPTAGRINIQDVDGKTIFGLPGSKMISVDMTADGSGIFYVKRSTNLIFRNLYFEGPGAYDTDGNDNMTIDDCQNVWVDHCEFHDGMDGNLDIKNASDYISVTWTKFSYEKPPKAGGPGGAPDHRYSNLFGSSDGATGDRGKLRITMQYCWWAEGCKERMPRVRFGKVHMANNYFSSTVANQGIRAGFEADILAEGNYFISGYAKPIDEFENNYTAILSRNNTGAADLKKGTAFTPPYTLAIAASTSIVTPITTCAGAKLPSPTGCSSCQNGNTNKVPTVSITSPANNATYAAPASIVINANATDSDGTISKVEFFNGNTLLNSDASSAYSYTWTNVAAGTYTINAIATDNQGATATASITVVVTGGNSGVAATLTKKGSGSATQTFPLGTALASFSYAWTDANTVTVVGMPKGVVADINTTSKTVTFSGTPTETGVFDFTVTTVGGNPETSKTGTITVTTITGVQDETLAEDLLVYPNPFNSDFMIHVRGDFEYAVSSISGAELESGNGTNTISIGDNLKSGLYVLKIKQGNNIKVVKVSKL